MFQLIFYLYFLSVFFIIVIIIIIIYFYLVYTDIDVETQEGAIM